MNDAHYDELAKQWPCPSGDFGEWVATHPGLAGVSLVTRSELAFLLDYIPGFGKLAEIGTACGVTAALIAKARPGLRILCIDDFSMGWPGTDTLTDWKKNRQTNMDLWFGTTSSLISCIGDFPRFDFVFSDADHHFDPTLLSLRHANVFLRSNGLIAVHDWGNPGWPDVAPAVDAFCGESRFEIIDSFRLMAILRKKQ